MAKQLPSAQPGRKVRRASLSNSYVLVNGKLEPVSWLVPYDLPPAGADRGMKVHMLRVRPGPFGGELRTSLCGRHNRACSDGMNVTDVAGDVTCLFCKARLPSSHGETNG
jgi:hypothetical protein